MVTQPCPTLCGHVDCSLPCLHVTHYLLEFAQVHAYCISDAVQPSHPLMTSSSALNLSQHQGLFQWVICLHQMNKILELQLQHQSSQWVNIQGWFPLRLTGLTSFLSKGLSGVFSSTTVQRHQFFIVQLSQLHDHWKDHRLDYMNLCGQNKVSTFQHTV